MRIVKRTEDMSPNGRLELIQQEDGDIIVSVFEYEDGMQMPSSSVEFCIPGSGGGHSPRTHAALRALMDAMEADDKGRHRPCDECDPTFGCFDGLVPCSKV